MIGMVINIKHRTVVLTAVDSGRCVPHPPTPYLLPVPLLHHLEVVLLLRQHRLREDEPLRVRGHARQRLQRVGQQLLLLLLLE